MKTLFKSLGIVGVVFLLAAFFTYFAYVPKTRAAILLVGTPVGANNDTSGTSLAAPSFNLTAGNLVVVFARTSSSSATNITSVTDTAGNTYTALTGEADSLNSVGNARMFYTYNAIGNASDVVTMNNGTAPFRTITVAQYSGFGTADPFDVQAGADTGNNGGSTTIGPTSAFTTTQTNELLVAAATVDNNTVSFTAGAGYTLELTNFNSGYTDQVVSSIQTNATASMTQDSANHWIIRVATFKAAPAPPRSAATPSELIRGGVKVRGGVKFRFDAILIEYFPKLLTRANLPVSDFDFFRNFYDLGRGS